MMMPTTRQMNRHGTRPPWILPLMASLALLAAPPAATAWERGKVDTFATLPAGEAHPEGIAVDRAGNVYVTTVAANKPASSEGTLLVFDPRGRHLRTVTVKGSSRLLLDIQFHPRTGKLLVADYKGGRILSVDTVSGDSTVFMTVGGKNPGLNSIIFDDAGHAYVTDSHQGIVWKTGPEGGEATAWVTSPLLRPTRLPPGIGANGMAFDKARKALFVANTAQDTIVRIPLAGPGLEPGQPQVFVHRVGGGPDGLHVDEQDRLWVACNQSNEILVLETAQGRVLGKLGDFGGIDRDGRPIGLLWPNSFAFRGDDVLVTNLSLDVGTMMTRLADELGLTALLPLNLRTVDGPWASEVRLHTVAKISKRQAMASLLPGGSYDTAGPARP
jgi:sugar lactone lactonase YvrE